MNCGSSRLAVATHTRITNSDEAISRKQFLVIYPDGSKEHIGCAERDSLILSQQIKQIDANRFRWIAPARTYHTFADLAELLPRMSNPIEIKRRFLSGCFIVEPAKHLNKRKYRELMETPEALALRVVQMVSE